MDKLNAESTWALNAPLTQRRRDHAAVQCDVINTCDIITTVCTITSHMKRFVCNAREGKSR